MARKLFLIIAIFLLIGQLVGQASADEDDRLSELFDDPDGPDELAYNIHSRVKRGERSDRLRQRIKENFERHKPGLKKFGEAIRDILIALAGNIGGLIG